MDILSFLLDAIRAELGADIFTDEKRARFELSMRAQVGAERHYIASAAALQRAERNTAIIRHLMAGGSVPDAVERYGLDDRHIRRIRQQAIDAGIYKNGQILP